MIVVADTSPINYLLLIGESSLLARLFGRVILPPAVVAELSADGAPRVVTDWVVASPEWVDVRPPKRADPTLSIGPGEREAICLARELGADFLLIDDAKGRKIALRHGLVAVGTLALLFRAAERGHVLFPECVGRLLRTSFRSPAGIVAALLESDARRRAQNEG